MNLLPFTLEGWRSGLVPCTADGREVKQLTLFEGNRIVYPLVGVIDSDLCSWTLLGRNLQWCAGNKDLRLRPKTEKRWVIVFICDRTKLERADVWQREPPKLETEIARVEIEVPCL